MHLYVANVEILLSKEGLFLWKRKRCYSGRRTEESLGGTLTFRRNLRINVFAHYKERISFKYDNTAYCVRYLAFYFVIFIISV